MDKKLQKIYTTYYNLLIAQEFIDIFMASLLSYLVNNLSNTDIMIKM